MTVPVFEGVFFVVVVKNVYINILILLQFCLSFTHSQSALTILSGYLVLHLHSRHGKLNHTGSQQTGCDRRRDRAPVKPSPGDNSHSTSAANGKQSTLLECFKKSPPYVFFT